jgi:hypothetical protein
VAIHDESRAIDDRRVSSFFGLGVPEGRDLEFRIEGFIANLERLRACYLDWANDGRFLAILPRLQERVPELLNCYPVRVVDFLVWTASGGGPDAAQRIASR